MNQMPSVMSHNFSQVPKAEIQRSSFDRSHGHKSTFDAGKLVPCFVDEVLPGDSFSLNMSAFARLATPLHPIMDNVYLDTFFFFVPNRLVWDNWQKFNGEQVDPGDSTDFAIPTVDNTAPGFSEGTLFDHFGVPIGINIDRGSVPGISALPSRAYNLIYNEWFRDENLIDSVSVPTGDGPDDYISDYNSGALLNRGKRHDYFTSCLPFPQKGDAVELPLGAKAYVAQDGTGTNPIVGIERPDVGTSVYGLDVDATSGSTTEPVRTESTGGLSDTVRLYADLSSATAATINELREAFQIQKLLERDARGGTRYTEIVRAHFGVTSPDARLQRPEYLGGGTQRVNVSPVPQTSSTDATTPQGNLAAFGTASINGHGFTKSFTEHGHIIGIISARADLTYQQGLNRMWSRQDRYDFYWPALAHLGEQEVLNKEIYAQGTSDDDLVFGYQERYAEYRYKPSTIAGAFRSGAATTLDSWHLSQEFSSLPTLGETFITENPPIDRCIAVPAEPHFIADFWFSLKCARPMPMYGVPGLIDHF